VAKRRGLVISHSWILFIGIFLILIGVYAAGRTVINIVAFPKYPTTGVLSTSLMGFVPYEQREEDCMYVQTYYDEEGNVRTSTDVEREQEQMNTDRCLDSIQSSRDAAKANDIGQSALFLFLGAGVLIARKIFFS
jgi:hypothetical protein